MLELACENAARREALTDELLGSLDREPDAIDRSLAESIASLRVRAQRQQERGHDAAAAGLHIRILGAMRAWDRRQVKKRRPFDREARIEAASEAAL